MTRRNDSDPIRVMIAFWGTILGTILYQYWWAFALVGLLILEKKGLV